VIEHALEIAQPRIEEHGHSLSVSLPAVPLQVDGDMTRLAQVFSNLLINAAKYTPAGGRLGLTMEAVGDEVEVRVSDNGIGISAEQMPHLFEMFTQGDSLPIARRAGMGIGLSLARGLVEMHGGRISAHSAGLGLGSEFVVRLPLAGRRPSRGGPRPAAKRRAGRPPAACWWPTTCATAPTAWAADRAHGAHGRDRLRRRSGAARAERFRPDIVLLDLGMPKLDGFEVSRRIRAAPWSESMRLVAQSGWGQEEDGAAPPRPASTTTSSSRSIRGARGPDADARGRGPPGA
jgi:CheY-like chemotaxis protein